MGRLSNLKNKAQKITKSVAGTVGEATKRTKEKTKKTAKEAKKRVNKEKSDIEEFRSDEVKDQLEARKERARIEAQRDARRERRKQKLQEVREEARQAVKEEQESGGGLLEQIVSATGSIADEIDMDGDDEVLIDELQDPVTEESSSQSGQQAQQAGGFGGVEQPGVGDEDLRELPSHRQPGVRDEGLQELPSQDDVARMEKEMLQEAEDMSRDESADSERRERDVEGADPLGQGFDAAEQFGLDDEEGF